MSSGRVVVVEDDAGFREQLVATLGEAGYEVRSASDGAAGFVLLRQWPPDAVLVDWVLPVLDGGALTRAIKADPMLARIFVIIASARGEGAMRAEGFEIGADDYLVKPIEPRELLARLRNGLILRRLQSELEEKNRELARLAATDFLTGLPNRRSFDATLERELRSARRHGDPVALILLDIDEFKSINDRFGHDVGDGVLREIAARLRGACRGEDTVARVGGEEFALIVTRTTGERAVAVGERTLALFSGRPFVTAAGALAITVSAGVAAAGGRLGFEAPEIFRAADAALYASKEGGRNRVTLRTELAPPRVSPPEA
jgi:diguanylate cyclase (GGDEF)-like protein